LTLKLGRRPFATGNEGTMLAVCRQSLMKYLASLSLAAGCGLADPGPSLAQIPARLITELTEDSADADWRDGDRVAVLRLLINDRRAQVRCAVAQALSALRQPLAPDSLDLLQTLALDRAWPVREAAAQALGQGLCRTPVSERVRTACEWSLAETAHQRVAIARALTRAIRVPGVDVILAHLAHDPDPGVRTAALGALAVQLEPEDPVFTEVIHGALEDSERAVRRAAKKLMVRTLRNRAATALA
jgi:hypothetical protein